MPDDMATVNELLEKIGAANLDRAEAFAKLFPSLTVNCARTKGGTAMAAFHNKETGWGFTAQFVSTPDDKNHIHAFTEFVGAAEDAENVAVEFQKIVGK